MERTEGGVAMTTDLAWGIYNFINEWKAGNHGECSLQDALDKDFGEEGYKKDIWHSADDKPEKGKLILYKSVYGGYYAVTTQHFPKTIIDKWCYIEDIENKNNEL